LEGLSETGLTTLRESTPLEQLCTYPNDAATNGNIFGTDVEELSVPSSYFLDVFNILKFSFLYGRLYFWKQPEVIQSLITGTRWMFHFINQFFSPKLLDRERLVSCGIVMVEKPIVGPKFGSISMHVTATLSKFSCIATALILKRLHKCTRVRTFSTFSSVL
jgi:hypothetical protein